MVPFVFRFEITSAIQKSKKQRDSYYLSLSECFDGADDAETIVN